MADQGADISAPSRAERWRVLHQLEAWLEAPMLTLSFVWLLLVVAELVWGASQLLQTFGTAIWAVFLAEFVLRLTLAPDRMGFIRRNWLTVLALAVPALRMFRWFRFLRLARAARGMRLVRIVGTANRSMNALRASMRRRGLGYALLLTTIVALLGAGGMRTFEPSWAGAAGSAGYVEALWRVAMLMAGLGLTEWPQTVEGRVLCFLLALFSVGVFGYITATFASFFLDQDLSGRKPPTRRELAALRAEIEALRTALRRAREEPPPG